MPRAEVTFDLDAAWEAIHAAQAEIDIYKQSRKCFVDINVFTALVSHATRLALAVDSLFDERTKATERERIATTAYDQQQSSYRELEALYQAMTDRAPGTRRRRRRTRSSRAPETAARCTAPAGCRNARRA
jgi:hypothetical protein